MHSPVRVRESRYAILYSQARVRLKTKNQAIVKRQLLDFYFVFYSVLALPQTTYKEPSKYNEKSEPVAYRLGVRIFTSWQGKLVKLMSFANSDGDVADPWYTDRFDIAYSDIYRGCSALLDKINL